MVEPRLNKPKILKLKRLDNVVMFTFFKFDNWNGATWNVIKLLVENILEMMTYWRAHMRAPLG